MQWFSKRKVVYKFWTNIPCKMSNTLMMKITLQVMFVICFVLIKVYKTNEFVKTFTNIESVLNTASMIRWFWDRSKLSTICLLQSTKVAVIFPVPFMVNFHISRRFLNIKSKFWIQFSHIYISFCIVQVNGSKLLKINSNLTFWNKC